MIGSAESVHTQSSKRSLPSYSFFCLLHVEGVKQRRGSGATEAAVRSPKAGWLLCWWFSWCACCLCRGVALIAERLASMPTDCVGVTEGLWYSCASTCDSDSIWVTAALAKCPPHRQAHKPMYTYAIHISLRIHVFIPSPRPPPQPPHLPSGTTLRRCRHPPVSKMPLSVRLLVPTLRGCAG
jgi:hypothetical protein